MNILIVDDDRASLLLLEATLVGLGHTVVTATGGVQARRAVEGQHHPLVISDWMMPDFDGLDLCRLIRTNLWEGRYTYVVLLTALEGKANFLEAMEAGTDDFITKPFDTDQLVARLRVAERILRLQSTVHELEVLLPICSYCKSIRQDDQYWQRVEDYLTRREDTVLTHGICPACYETHVRPQLDRLKRAG